MPLERATTRGARTSTVPTRCAAPCPPRRPSLSSRARPSPQHVPRNAQRAWSTDTGASGTVRRQPTVGVPMTDHDVSRGHDGALRSGATSPSLRRGQTIDLGRTRRRANEQVTRPRPGGAGIRVIAGETPVSPTPAEISESGLQAAADAAEAAARRARRLNTSPRRPRTSPAQRRRSVPDEWPVDKVRSDPTPTTQTRRRAGSSRSPRLRRRRKRVSVPTAMPPRGGRGGRCLLRVSVVANGETGMQDGYIEGHAVGVGSSTPRLEEWVGRDAASRPHQAR